MTTGGPATPSHPARPVRHPGLDVAFRLRPLIKVLHDTPYAQPFGERIDRNPGFDTDALNDALTGSEYVDLRPTAEVGAPVTGESSQRFRYSRTRRRLAHLCALAHFNTPPSTTSQEIVADGGNSPGAIRSDAGRKRSAFYLLADYHCSRRRTWPDASAASSGLDNHVCARKRRRSLSTTRAVYMKAPFALDRESCVAGCLYQVNSPYLVDTHPNAAGTYGNPNVSATVRYLANLRPGFT